MSVYLILFVVSMFLWLVTILPFPAASEWGRASGFLAWSSVLLCFLTLTHGAHL